MNLRTFVIVAFSLGLTAAIFHSLPTIFAIAIIVLFLILLVQNKNQDVKITSTKGIEDKVESDVKNQIDKIRELKKSAASKEELSSLFNEVLIPKTFFEIIGELNIKTKNFLVITSKGNNQNEAIKDSSWKELEEIKKVCDNFFDGNELVRIWCIAKTMIEWGIPYERLEQFNPGTNELRKKYWGFVALEFHLAKKIEKENGPNTCTKDLLDTERLKFIQLTKTQHNPKETKDYIENFIKRMSKEQLRHWQLLV